MTNVAIFIDKVSKQYRLGKIGSRLFIRELHRLFTSIAGKKRDVSELQTPGEVITALSNCTFSVPQGELVGVIGKNGSGKSTLLKLLAGITRPSGGCIELRGRIASLLDIGVGFAGDLSARENIFLNGAMLGLHRDELHDRFDDIVAFAEIGTFLDTPVKRFSSGMYIRLAFSIAIHVVANILLIDEILAAADRSFIERCRSKISDLAASGTTVLIVSHNLRTIESLCTRTLLLDAGTIIADGATADVIKCYRTRPQLSQ